jgi:hypothetical protein
VKLIAIWQVTPLQNGTGLGKIKMWCLGEDLIKSIELQINETKTVQELSNILLNYPTLRTRIESQCLQRKSEIEGVVPDQQVVNT